MATIGENLSVLRERMGLTQDDVASYLEVKRPIVSYYETNERPVPVHHLEKLADLYMVEVADLVGEPSAEQTVGLSLAFRADGLSAEDLQGIGRFKRIVKNYIKMKALSNEQKVGT